MAGAFLVGLPAHPALDSLVHALLTTLGFLIVGVELQHLVIHLQGLVLLLHLVVTRTLLVLGLYLVGFQLETLLQLDQG